MSKDYDITLEVGLDSSKAVEQMDKLVSDLSGKTVNVKVSIENINSEVHNLVERLMKELNN